MGDRRKTVSRVRRELSGTNSLWPGEKKPLSQSKLQQRIVFAQKKTGQPTSWRESWLELPQRRLRLPS